MLGLAALLAAVVNNLPVVFMLLPLAAPLGEFTRLGVATVLPGLALSVIALWLGLQA